jgi:hypothetical protein
MLKDTVRPARRIDGFCGILQKFDRISFCSNLNRIKLTHVALPRDYALEITAKKFGRPE